MQGASQKKFVHRRNNGQPTTTSKTDMINYAASNISKPNNSTYTYTLSQLEHTVKFITMPQIPWINFLI
jgi:hypothetical protein